VLCVNGGLYAPTIRHRDGVFYVVCTNIIHPDDGHTVYQNFVVSSTDIWADKWSDPVFFDFTGIDTSIFWDDDGRAYMHGSAAPGPMTIIRIFEIDLQTGKKLSDEKEIWGGTGGIWPEGPHIYRVDGWYYLVISEGGTFDDHMITAARSKSILGPYEPCPQNPILTARGTDEYIQRTGHSDMFQDERGNWWAVCLGIRKAEGGRYIMGRETFLTSVDWPKGGWPTLNQVKMKPSLKEGLQLAKDTSSMSVVSNADLCYVRDADLSAHKISEDGNVFTLRASACDLSQAGPEDKITFVGKRQRALKGVSQVVLESAPAQLVVKAGLTVFKDEHRVARIFYDSSAREIVFEIWNTAKSASNREAKALTDGRPPTGFRLDYSESLCEFSFQSSDSTWHRFGEFDTLMLSGLDFVGPVIGVYACGDAEAEVVFKDLHVE
jgi:beta-xylosidase